MSSILRNSLSAIKLPDSSRVWLFGAQRILTEIEEISIHRRLLDFIAGWQAHGKDLTADFCIIHRCVLVVVVDESKEAPSGCSIDKVFQLLQSQKEKFDLDFFNGPWFGRCTRVNFVFLINKKYKRAWIAGK